MAWAFPEGTCPPSQGRAWRASPFDPGDLGSIDDQGLALILDATIALGTADPAIGDGDEQPAQDARDGIGCRRRVEIACHLVRPEPDENRVRSRPETLRERAARTHGHDGEQFVARDRHRRGPDEPSIIESDELCVEELVFGPTGEEVSEPLAVEREEAGHEAVSRVGLRRGVRSSSYRSGHAVLGVDHDPSGSPSRQG